MLLHHPRNLCSDSALLLTKEARRMRVLRLEDATMLREPGFMQAAIVFLLLTNAATALVALYATKTANALVRPAQQKSALERKLDVMLNRG